ncbi:MAG TPA: hypothetical protein VK034_06850, partial [Enhygromyxa sp.]|nr:hypothetical protein [Enhygromyxa sp.]
MNTILVRRLLLVSTAAVVGIGLGCLEITDNQDHCWFKDGDATCKQVFGAERPYCSWERQGCGGRSELGCMAEKPEDRCYSPCGGGRSSVEDDSCVEELADAEGETGEPGDDEGGDSGDDAVEPGVCGDGAVDHDEGEECDDGNVESGDGCLADCRRPGAVKRQRHFDLRQGHEVVIDADDEIAVIFWNEMLQGWLYCFDHDIGVLGWTKTLAHKTSLAVAADGTLFTGGHTDTKVAEVVAFGEAGDSRWSPQPGPEDSSFLSIEVAGNFVVAAGYRSGDQGYLWRGTRDAMGEVIWTELPDQARTCSAAAVNVAGRIWMVCDDPLELRTDHLGPGCDDDHWPVVLDAGRYEELLVDENNSVYVLANTDKGALSLRKYHDCGEHLWTNEHPAVVGGGFARLSGGAILVAGHSADRKHALLAWYDETTGTPLYQQEIKGKIDDVTHDLAFFNDVAVAPSGNFAVAVG